MPFSRRSERRHNVIAGRSSGVTARRRSAPVVQAQQPQAMTFPGHRRIHGSTEDFEFVRRISTGGTATCDLVRRKADGVLLVRKIHSRFTMVENIKPLEVRILHDILPPHNRTIDLIAYSHHTRDPSLTLYFEYCEGPDLSHIIRKRKILPESFIWHVFVQIAEALALLHYGHDRKHSDQDPQGWQTVVHRDVKPGNIFLRSSPTHNQVKGLPYPSIVLADFGLATLQRETKSPLAFVDYLAPESAQYTHRSDVWGLGAIIHALAHFRPPFQPLPSTWADTRRNREIWAQRSESRQARDMPTRFSSRLNRNMMDCLQKDPRNRVSSKELLRHLLRDRPQI